MCESTKAPSASPTLAGFSLPFSGLPVKSILQVWRADTGSAHISAMNTTFAAQTATTDPASSQQELFTLASGPERSADAARQAVESHGDAYADLSGEADNDIVEAALKDDAKVLRAVEHLGALSADEQHEFGMLLATQLVEDAIKDEADHWLGKYRAQPAIDTDGQDVAYERNDPKHPEFLEYAIAS